MEETETPADPEAPPYLTLYFSAGRAAYKKKARWGGAARSRRGLGTMTALALSHDGLWVFANRILANRIFAHRIFADWRRRHRGRLLARQIGGSGNAQHGDEPSRYDYDDLHDANPLVLGTRTGDRVTPLFRFVC